LPNNWSSAYGQWALITGASDGIGKAIAYELAQRGVNLVLASRRGELLASLGAELEAKHNIKTLVIAADLGTRSGLDRLIENTAGIEIGTLILAAGYGQFGDFIEGSQEADMVAVNCTASVALARHFAPLMVRRNKGAIVMFSSIVAFQGAPFSANYAATKAYIQTLAEGLYHELKPHKIDVLCVAPGPVNTGFATRANMVMGKAETPETVARATMKAIGKTFVLRPGFLAKLLGYSIGMLPRFVRVVMMGKIMGASVNRSGAANSKT
jgi:uncharacterized protein